jgi:hypothetical protein
LSSTDIQPKKFVWEEQYGWSLSAQINERIYIIMYGEFLTVDISLETTFFYVEDEAMIITMDHRVVENGQNI